jgi:RimJ/RimL family protein N-acetyltransferase
MPVIQSKSDIHDYEFLKSIFKDSDVMKTSTLFACQTPDSDLNMNKAIESFIEKNLGLRKTYGLHKVFDTKLQQYIAICGLTRNSVKLQGISREVIEVCLFVKAEKKDLGLGSQIGLSLMRKVDELDSIAICSIWEKNFASIRLAEKNGFKYVSTIKKSFRDKMIKVNTYIKFPGSFNGWQTIDKKSVENLLVTKKVVL